MEIHSLPPEGLTRFIDRIRKFEIDRYEDYLHTLLLRILSELGEFVPTEGSMILADEPTRKHEGKSVGDLVYVAASGKNASQLVGKKVSATSGIIGETYTLGKATVRKAERGEPIVLDKVNFPYPIDTLVTSPLRIENAIVGVLVLYNKKEPVGFTLRDLKLVEIFSGYISTSFQNATDARKSKELSKRDDLTGLFNDRFFHRQLEAEIIRADEKRYPLTLIFLDLDNFKAINDQYGHLVGSQTLKEVGFLLREAVDLDQATIARYGGDEYVTILPGLDLERAVDVADRIRLTIKGKMFMIDQGEQDGSFINFKDLISASIGVSSLHDHLPSGGTSKERKNLLIRLADQAMYRAKADGKNCVRVGEPPRV
ncbi:MAG TPA: sensor domain-containing diguanylate cyclase, partial [Bdellovibrionota bacterium]|nr:sensor domain-containing diguanylate cyclase [Bdellovibrionota bacterium]